MSASEHRKHAGTHAADAERHEGKYDQSKEQIWYPTKNSASLDATWSERVYNPTKKHRAEATPHRRHADQHAAAARELEQFTLAECGKFPPATRTACPLLGAVDRVEDVEGGARLVLSEGMPADAVVDHVRCHHAFGREHGQQGMDECPLYLRDLDIERGADGRSVTITSKNPRSVELIRQRSRTHTGS